MGPAVDAGLRRRAPLLALCLLLAASPAAAQALLAPGIDVDAGRGSIQLEPGEREVFDARVTNSGGVAGDVSLTAKAPPGWTVTVEPAAFALEAGASRTVRVTLTAAADVSESSVAPLALAATLTDAAGRTATDQANVGLAFVLPPVVAPPSRAPLYAGLAGAVLVAALVGGGAYRQRRQRLAREAAERAEWTARETGVTVQTVGLPKTLGDRRELYVRVLVKNVSEKPRVALVGLEPPEGWTGAVQLPRLALSPGESMGVAAHFRPGPGVETGTRGKAVVWTKPEEARERDERVAIDLVAPAARPAAFHLRGAP